MTRRPTFLTYNAIACIALRGRITHCRVPVPDGVTATSDPPSGAQPCRACLRELRWARQRAEAA